MLPAAPEILPDSGSHSALLVPAEVLFAGCGRDWSRLWVLHLC